MAAHHEIRELAYAMIARSKDGEFILAEIIAEMKARNSAYSERTIRTHVTSRMCANTPKNHAIVYNDFWCIDRGSGRYRLFNPETDLAVRLRKRTARIHILACRGDHITSHSEV